MSVISYKIRYLLNILYIFITQIYLKWWEFSHIQCTIVKENTCSSMPVNNFSWTIIKKHDSIIYTWTKMLFNDFSWTLVQAYITLTCGHIGKVFSLLSWTNCTTTFSTQSIKCCQRQQWANDKRTDNRNARCCEPLIIINEVAWFLPKNACITTNANLLH